MKILTKNQIFLTCIVLDILDSNVNNYSNETLFL